MNSSWSILEIVMLVLGILLVIVLICYAFSFNRAIITSKLTAIPVDETADHYYYLPCAFMTLTVTAKIKVDRLITNKSISGYQLLNLSFDPVVDVRPDSRAMVLVTYKGNWFSNDELQIVSTSSGLLETVKSITEDRIGNIVAQITQAHTDLHKSFADDKRINDVSPVEEIETEIIEVKRLFTVSNEEIEKGKIEKRWKIPLNNSDGKAPEEADASFTLENPKTTGYIGFPTKPNTDGLYARPMVAQEWALIDKGLKNPLFVCQVPDTGSLLRIPIRRSPFVKKQQMPKFEKGVLVENSIVKPSEMEVLASIPINILKAIMSIPAQLFQFKLIRVKQDTEYQTELNELAKAKSKVEQQLHEATIKELEKKIADLKKESPSDQVDRHPQEEPQLGKLPPKEFKDDTDTTNVAEVREVNTKSLTELPQLREPHSWADKNNVWDEYDNLQKKTCVPASAAYLYTAWTSNSNTPTKFFSVKNVLDTLTEVAPNNDISNGCHMLDLLLHWRSKGIRIEKENVNVKIDNFRPIKIKDTRLLKHAIYWFGGCMIGLQLPESMKKSTDWIFSESMVREKKEGHSVCVLGYNGNKYVAISFGKQITMDEKFYEAFNDESYIVLSAENWTTGQNQSPTEPAFGFKDLQDMMIKIYSGKA